MLPPAYIHIYPLLFLFDLFNSGNMVMAAALPAVTTLQDMATTLLSSFVL